MEVWEQAQAYLLLAGDQAVGVAADAEGLALYRRALTAYKNAFGDELEPVQQASLAHKMGAAYYGLGRSAESLEQLSQAAALLDKPLPTTKFGLMAGILGQILRQVLHRLWPPRFVGRASEASVAANREVFLVYELLTKTFVVLGDALSFIFTAIRGANLAEAAGPSPGLARGYANLGMIMTIARLHSRAQTYFRSALEIAKESKDPPALAYIREIIGFSNLISGRMEDALDSLEQASAISQRIGLLRFWQECQVLSAIALHYHGQFERSNRLFIKLYTLAQERGDGQIQFWALCGLVETGHRLDKGGALGPLNTFLEEAESLLAERHYTSVPDQIMYFGLLAQTRLRQGAKELAIQAAEMAAQLIAAEFNPITPYSLEGYVGPPVVYLTLWEADVRGGNGANGSRRFQRPASDACKSLRRYARIFPFAASRAWLWQGLYEWLDRKPKKANHAWQKSMKLARKLDMPYEQGLVHYQIGRHLQAGDPGREEQLKLAAGIFSKLGAAYDLEQVQQELLE